MLQGEQFLWRSEFPRIALFYPTSHVPCNTGFRATKLFTGRSLLVFHGADTPPLDLAWLRLNEATALFAHEMSARAAELGLAPSGANTFSARPGFSGVFVRVTSGDDASTIKECADYLNSVHLAVGPPRMIAGVGRVEPDVLVSISRVPESEMCGVMQRTRQAAPDEVRAAIEETLRKYQAAPLPDAADPCTSCAAVVELSRGRIGALLSLGSVEAELDRVADPELFLASLEDAHPDVGNFITTAIADHYLRTRQVTLIVAEQVDESPADTDEASKSMFLSIMAAIAWRRWQRTRGKSGTKAFFLFTIRPSRWRNWTSSASRT